MTPRPRVFWDSSAIISAVLSPNPDSPGRRLLRLGESGVVDHRLSRDVIRDLEYVVEKQDPSATVDTAVVLDRARFATAPDAGQDTVRRCQELTGYRPDARVLGCAVECGAELLVTFDERHLLGNPLIGPSSVGLRVMTPQEALDWCHARLREIAA